MSFINVTKFTGNTLEASLRIPLTTLEMANHPTGDDREDEAQDRKPKTGSNSIPPERITNKELWTPSIDHNGRIDAALAQLYMWHLARPALPL